MDHEDYPKNDRGQPLVNGRPVGMWRGKHLTEYTKDELIETLMDVWKIYESEVAVLVGGTHPWRRHDTR